MQNRRKAKARAVVVSRPDWMPQPFVLSVLLALWTAATALHFLPHVWMH
jgi:hypothetical protein